MWTGKIISESLLDSLPLLLLLLLRRLALMARCSWDVEGAKVSTKRFRVEGCEVAYAGGSWWARCCCSCSWYQQFFQTTFFLVKKSWYVKLALFAQISVGKMARFLNHQTISKWWNTKTPGTNIQVPQIVKRTELDEDWPEEHVCCLNWNLLVCGTVKGGFGCTE